MLVSEDQHITWAKMHIVNGFTSAPCQSAREPEACTRDWCTEHDVHLLRCENNSASLLLQLSTLLVLAVLASPSVSKRSSLISPAKVSQ